MAKETLYGIKYPFTNESWRGGFLDLNEDYKDQIQSELLHIIFTPKGQRLRMPEFGSDLIKYIFEPNDDETWGQMKNDIKRQVSLYLKDVTFKDISVYRDENNDNAVYAIITYSIKNGKDEEEYKITVPVV